ncbi:MAG: DNA alkylation repair protein [Bacilli bacterium]|nr:DNA alkylation repair protein [Bacilli bacterium]
MQYMIDLMALKDDKLKAFQAKLIPTVDENTIIGIKTDVLRKIAKDMIKANEADDFIKVLPHKYFEENQIHVFILSELKDYDKCIKEIDIFLDYVDNWATCDQMSPKIFKKHLEDLRIKIMEWINSNQTYRIRFGVSMLLAFCLDDAFRESDLSVVANIKSEEYYVNMMIAWYFSTALVKQYDCAIKVIENNDLSKFCHNKTIQKAIESYRISDEKKAYLRSLKIK